MDGVIIAFIFQFGFNTSQLAAFQTENHDTSYQAVYASHRKDRNCRFAQAKKFAQYHFDYGRKALQPSVANPAALLRLGF
ncbi:MAG: hypothetical protein ABIF85_04750 [Nanoarchaeota archaeon]|nr:hypothetical protein [Nanoarchaeota archaeon]